MWSKGYGAEEAKIAFTRARELGAVDRHPAERFPTYYGLWVGNLVRGELAAARTTANSFLRDANSAQSRGRSSRCAPRPRPDVFLARRFQRGTNNFQEVLKITIPTGIAK